MAERIVPKRGSSPAGTKRVGSYGSDQQSRMEVNAVPQRAWVLEDHHHATIAESVDVARERRSVFSDILEAGKVYRLGSSGVPALHGYRLGLIEITPSSAV